MKTAHERIVDRLRELADAREQAEVAVAEAYDETLDLWEKGVAAGLSHAQLGAASRRTKSAVTVALGKRRSS